MKFVIGLTGVFVLIAVLGIPANRAAADEPFVAVMDMDMGIFPGTGDYLKTSIQRAEKKGAKLLVIILDTPGGMLQTSQDMIKLIFESRVPVVLYVSPSGSSATSAGVFITEAAHIAAMAPGTSIGAAHPVMGTGEDIAKDMRTKAENMTVAMVQSIAEQRGRNIEWVKKAIKESASITEKEALKENVIDVVADDLDDLLKKIKGREVEVAGSKVVLKDYSSLPRVEFKIGLKQKVLNTLANPLVASALWLGATTGLSIELYHPGAILPGVVGVICLVLALAVYEVIPINLSGVLLLVLGVLLIGAELFVPSGILGVGGIIALVFGSIYLIDTAVEPSLKVNMLYVGSAAAFLGVIILAVVYAVIRAHKRKVTTGSEGIIGAEGKAVSNVAGTGKVFVNGEFWNAASKTGIISKNSLIRVTGKKSGLVLEVEEVNSSEGSDRDQES